VNGWPYFGWAWFWAVAACVAAIILVGLAPGSWSFWGRVIAAFIAGVGAYVITLVVLTYYGIGI
jgi:hypothetical protein